MHRYGSQAKDDTRSGVDWRRFAVGFMTRRTCLKVAILRLVVLAAALLITRISPGTVCELSMHASTPVLMWVLLILTFAGGVFVILARMSPQGVDNTLAGSCTMQTNAANRLA